MDRRDYTTRAKKITVLDDEIRRFDTILVEIQEQTPEDFEFYERIVNVRDAMYRLKACMRNCIIESSSSPASDIGTPSICDDDDYGVTIETSWFTRDDEDEEEDDDDNERRGSQLVR